jgi:outer membrane protein assembly factor BamB
VYVGSHNYSVYALNASTGARVSNYTTGVESSPVAANGVVYVGSDDGYLYAFGLK